MPQLPCGTRCARYPNSADCSSCARSASSVTACSRPGWRVRCCSVPSAPPGPWEIAGSFAVLFLPYSLLGPFAGALLDRWDRRMVLVGANLARLVMMLGVAILLAIGAGDPAILCGALIVNGFTRFVSSGPVRGAAARRAAQAGGDDELGGHRDRRGRGLPRRQLHAGAAVAVRHRRRRGRLGDLHRVGARRHCAVAVGAVQATRARSRRQRQGRARLGGLCGGHRLGVRHPHGGLRPDGRRHAVRAGRPPRRVRHQHAAGAGARQAHRDAGRRGARHRGGVPRRDGPRGVPRHVRHPGCGRPVGTVRHRQRRARAGRDLPARRRRGCSCR